MKKRLALTAVGILTVATFTGLASSTATAGAACGSRGPSDIDHSAYPTAFETRGMYNGSSTNCSIISDYQSGDKLDYYCYTVNQSSGLTWTYLRDDHTDAKGWVRDSYLPGLGSSVHC